MIVREALLDDPRAGRRDRHAATGAYGYAMANNYNGVPRPPVIFCRDGDARVVVRRESFEDLIARDVPSENVPVRAEAVDAAVAAAAAVTGGTPPRRFASACSATAPSARRSRRCSTSAPSAIERLNGRTPGSRGADALARATSRRSSTTPI